LKIEAVSSPEKMKEYERAMNNARDIIDCRLRKIISLASSFGQTSQILENLSGEERLLYERLFGLIEEWRQAILETGGE
jgi:DNA replication initiation complex subunit (GINS family)